MMTVRAIDEASYWEFLKRTPGTSYQQTPEWARARGADWGHELVGWFEDDGAVVDDAVADDDPVVAAETEHGGALAAAETEHGGAAEALAVAVVRYRTVPVLNRRFGLISHGPVADWDCLVAAGLVGGVLAALADYLGRRGVFGVRISPNLPIRRWTATTVRSGLASAAVRNLGDLPPDIESPSAEASADALADAGWRYVRADRSGLGSQPVFNSWLSLAGRDDDELLSGMSKSWRKNLRSAGRAGVEAVEGKRRELTEAYAIYVQTSRRNGFDTQPWAFFESTWDSFSGEGFPGHFSMWTARQHGRLAAMYTAVIVGSRAEGLTSATSDERDQRGLANAALWSIVGWARDRGAADFDVGGVGDSLEAGEPGVGLVQFKCGMGAAVHEYVGNWDLPLEPRLYAAFTRLLPAYGRVSSLLSRR